MTSLQTQIFNRFSTLTVKSIRGSGQSFVRRFRFSAWSAAAYAPVPAGISVQKGKLAGVPGVWLTPQQIEGSMLYLHGGGFVAGSSRLYLPFCGALAKAFKLKVFLPHYRLAPEHPFPAGRDDCIRSFEALRNETLSTQPLIVAGDSAGGNLAMTVIQHAVATGLKVTLGMLISPSLDLRTIAPATTQNDQCDSMLSTHILLEAAKAYSAGHPVDDPRISPLLGEMGGLPPLLVTYSEHEVLRDDSVLLIEKARGAGADIQVIARPEMPHIWPIMTTLLPEAKEDFNTICAFIDKRIRV